MALSWRCPTLSARSSGMVQARSFRAWKAAWRTTRARNRAVDTPSAVPVDSHKLFRLHKVVERSESHTAARLNLTREFQQIVIDDALGDPLRERFHILKLE